MTADVDRHFLSVTLPLVSPSSDIYNARLQITLTSTTLQVVLDPFTCNGGPLCLDIDTVPGGTLGGEIHLGDAWYIGRVPQITPYIRSKLLTTESYVGCLGVSLKFKVHTRSMLCWTIYRML